MELSLGKVKMRDWDFYFPFFPFYTVRIFLCYPNITYVFYCHVILAERSWALFSHFIVHSFIQQIFTKQLLYMLDTVLGTAVNKEGKQSSCPHRGHSCWGRTKINRDAGDSWAGPWRQLPCRWKTGHGCHAKKAFWAVPWEAAAEAKALKREKCMVWPGDGMGQGIPWWWKRFRPFCGGPCKTV